MTDLSKKAVLVTGASRGIGAATATALGDAGAFVIAHYGSFREGAELAVARLPSERKLLVQADLSDPGAARLLWGKVTSACERVDVVVVNAGISRDTAFEGSDEQWDEGWDQVLRVNLLESASLMREAVRHFRGAGGGTIITISSWVAEQGSAIPHLSAYAASKAALRAVTQTVARNYAKDDILAYAIAPGIVKTRMSEISAAARGGLDKLNAILPLGEMVPPEEVATLITFLASGACRHLTGATFDVNGASYVR